MVEDIGSANSKQDKKVDIYRDTPVRLLGYANEVGESFRSLVHVNWVRFSYFVATAYVVADSVSKGIEANEKLNTQVQVAKDDVIATPTSSVTRAVVDSLIWQTLASVAIPGYTINRICYGSNILLMRKTKLTAARRSWAVMVIGLASIPFIIRPIDKGVDWLMENTFRNVFGGHEGPHHKVVDTSTHR